MFEAFRMNIPKTTGIVQWMLNSAWPSLYWQLYDYYLIPTAAYYSVKKSNLSQQLIYDYEQNAVFAVNEGTETYKLEAIMSLYNLDGNMQSRQANVLEVAPYTVVKAFDVPMVNDNAFLFLSLNQKNGVAVADNFYCLSGQKDEYDWEKSTWIRTPLKKSADFTKLSKMASAECQVKAKIKSEAGKKVLEVTLENAPDAIGFFIRLSLKDMNGELLYPVFWQDNYLSLAPGESRVLRCVIPDTAIQEEQIIITVAGWNVPEKKLVLPLS